MKGPSPQEVQEVADGLVYRDFITVRLLQYGMIAGTPKGCEFKNTPLRDNWIYIQEPDVKVERLQIFNNCGPYMAKDLNNVRVGLEYFCNEGDDLWNMPDRTMAVFIIEELATIGLVEKRDVLDSTVIRMLKTYPASFGSYDQFSMIQDFTDRIKNLFLIGHNGMHIYNNRAFLC